MDKAVYPGSFDPITKGHLDIIERASKFVNELVVAVGNNPQKETLFSVRERVEMIKEATGHLDNVKVKVFEGLLVNFMRREGISLVIRGLRAVSDFELELQMALMNKKLAEDIETIMLVTRGKYNFLSSSLVKEVAMFNGCIEGLVPENVAKKLKEKYQ